MSILDLLVDLSNAGALEDEGQACGRIKDHVCDVGRAWRDCNGTVAQMLWQRRCAAPETRGIRRAGR